MCIDDSFENSNQFSFSDIVRFQNCFWKPQILKSLWGKKEKHRNLRNKYGSPIYFFMYIQEKEFLD